MSRWEDFRRQICAGLSMGIAGIPWWTTDIGGFHDGWPEKPEFRELFIRWFQWGCYCPVMRLHGDRKPVENVYRRDGTAVLPSGADNEVWSYGEEAYPILVKYMKRREELRDYIRETMRQAHEAGTPVMRAMFYAFPEDAACAELKDQYMFGDRYLVAPVLEPGATPPPGGGGEGGGGARPRGAGGPGGGGRRALTRKRPATSGMTTCSSSG